MESGGPHQIKPWFEGKLDFVPDVREVPSLALQGASVGYFKDRKAAVIVYTFGLHVVTLIEPPADDRGWPSRAGEVRAETDQRGFSVFFWRSGSLGYAMVSDADPQALRVVAQELATRR